MANDYQDYNALNLLLAAIGTPSPGSGKTLIDVVTSLTSVISQIQAGSPPVAKPVQIINPGFGVILAAGATIAYGPNATNGSSYVISFTPWFNAVSTPPMTQVEIIIQDANANVLDNVTWELPGSHAGGNAQYVLSGPIVGPDITVQLFNQGNVNLHHTLSVVTSTLPLFKHSCQTTVFSGIDGYSVAAGGNPTELIQIAQQTIIGANSSTAFLLPPTSGQMKLTARGHQTPQSMIYALYPLAAYNSYAATAGVPIWRVATTATDQVTDVIDLPRAPLIVQATNANLTTGCTVDIGAIAVPV